MEIIKCSTARIVTYEILSLCEIEGNSRNAITDYDITSYTYTKILKLFKKIEELYQFILQLIKTNVIPQIIFCETYSFWRERWMKMFL